MSLLHGIPSLKMGPGDSARSHTADEYVLTEEITAGIKTYIDYIAKLANCI
jgi:acetylornithine deacetylase